MRSLTTPDSPDSSLSDPQKQPRPTDRRRHRAQGLEPVDQRAAQDDERAAGATERGDL